jgi:phosphatidylserine/phosphatidylglycerophosphate/cardiolipin synthase-like enzyme
MSAEFEKFLTQTIADRKFSASEKTALQNLVADKLADEQALALLRSKAFVVARQAIKDANALQVLDWLEDVLKIIRPKTPPASGASTAKPLGSYAYFSPGNTCWQQVVQHLQQARKSVDICVFTITDDRLANAILSAHQRKLAVRIISDNDKALDLGSDIDKFRAAGIPVRLDKTQYHMHHKFCVVDGTTLLNGSYNWTRGAAEQNQENLVVSTDPGLVLAFGAEFEKLWKQFA